MFLNVYMVPVEEILITDSFQSKISAVDCKSSIDRKSLALLRCY